MNRFENVDVLAALEQLMRQNTAFYRNDFEIDKEIIGRAAASDKAEDRTLLWMSRPSGTHCFRESDVYLQGTRQHNTWKFYGEQTRDRVLAYAVELTGKVRGVIRGNLYELDYPQHFRHVAAEAVQADNIILHYEKGDREQPAGLYFDGRPDPKLGAFLRYEAKPNEPEHLRELSPYFVQMASSKDTDRLFSMLPYKSLAFTGMKDRHGLYAVIGKDENRDKEVRRPRASIRRQLSETKQAQAPKKAPARTKKNELEV